MIHVCSVVPVLVLVSLLSPTAGCEEFTLQRSTFRTPQLFALPAEDLSRPAAEDWLAGQLVEKDSHASADQMFGAGVALGFAGDPIGLGLSGWFDVYFTTWIAAEARLQLAYGLLTHPYQDSGTGVEVGLQLGAKFVFDMPDWEWSRWCRPFAAFFPVGFRYMAADEEFNPPGPGNSDHVHYSDVFFVIGFGGGCDFFLTPNIAIGVGLFVDGMIGGSRHDRNGVVVRTRGRVDVFFEYFRLAMRF